MNSAAGTADHAAATYACAASDVATSPETDPAGGLTTAEAASRLARYGRTRSPGRSRRQCWFRVVALSAPTIREKSQIYLQRYVPLLHAAREVIIFDHSWYHRAGVERVMRFCTPETVTRFLPDTVLTRNKCTTDQRGPPAEHQR